MSEQNTSLNPEDDPLYLSEEEQERIFKLTDQFSRPQALRKVLRGERYRRYVAAEARQKMQQSSEEAKLDRQAREEELARERREEIIEIIREPDTESPDENPKQ